MNPSIDFLAVKTTKKKLRNLYICISLYAHYYIYIYIFTYICIVCLNWRGFKRNNGIPFVSSNRYVEIEKRLLLFTG